MQPKRYDKATKDKAIRLVLDHQDDYPPRWQAIQSVANRLGMTPETLRSWINQFQIDSGNARGLSGKTKAEIARLRCGHTSMARESL